jgi:adenylate cyclase
MTTKTIALHPLAPAPAKTEVELKRLLQDRLDRPDQATTIDAQIQQTFVERYAIMNLDMSGFSRLTRHYGIIGTLAEIQKMRNLVTPVVQNHSGKVVKYEADNIYSVYAKASDALAAAIAILQTLETAGMRGSIGIGYGDLIMLTEAGQDAYTNAYTNAYGDQMNLAAKLGEDLAEVNEILLTEEAFEQVGDRTLLAKENHAGGWRSRLVTISGIEFPVYCTSFTSLAH